VRHEVALLAHLLLALNMNSMELLQHLWAWNSTKLVLWHRLIKVFLKETKIMHKVYWLISVLLHLLTFIIKTACLLDITKQSTPVMIPILQQATNYFQMGWQIPHFVEQFPFLWRNYQQLEIKIKPNILLDRGPALLSAVSATARRIPRR